MKNEIENINSPNDDEEVAPEPESEEVVPEPESEEVGFPADPIEVEPKDEEEGDSELLKQKNQELYEQLKKSKGFIRDKKTGKWVKKEQPKPEKEVEGTGDITKTELYSLVKANVPEEDVNEVTIYARSHNISVTEALKLPEVKAILKVKQEYRKTQEASNTGSSRRGSSKITDEMLLSQANKGIMPDSEEDMVRLIRARRESKQAK